MADLGFLPVVRRHRPRRGPVSACSSPATLDAGIDVLAKRYLTKPVTHQADSAQSPVAEIDHHVLHVAADAHFPVLRPFAPRAHDCLHPTKHRAELAVAQCRRCRLSRFMATSRRTPGRARWMPSTAGPLETLVVDGISPPAASTPTMSAWSSTPTRRSSTRPICAAPAVSARRQHGHGRDHDARRAARAEVRDLTRKGRHSTDHDPR